MKTRMVVLVALASLFTAFAANAGPPQKFHEDWEVMGFWVGSCGDFQILADNWVSSDVTVFFDQQGNVVKDFWQNRWLTMFYNSEHPEIAIEGQPAQHDLYITDYRKQRLAAIGMYTQVILPHQGVLMLDAGRILFDTTTWDLVLVVGRHDSSAWDGSANLDKMCAALAGP